LIERVILIAENVRIAELHIRSILTHVTDCGSALLLVKLLSGKKEKSILTARCSAKRENLIICSYTTEACDRMLRRSLLRMLFGGC